MYWAGEIPQPNVRLLYFGYVNSQLIAQKMRWALGIHGPVGALPFTQSPSCATPSMGARKPTARPEGGPHGKRGGGRQEGAHVRRQAHHIAGPEQGRSPGDDSKDARQDHVDGARGGEAQLDGQAPRHPHRRHEEHLREEIRLLGYGAVQDPVRAGVPEVQGLEVQRAVARLEAEPCPKLSRAPYCCNGCIERVGATITTIARLSWTTRRCIMKPLVAGRP